MFYSFQYNTGIVLLMLNLFLSSLLFLITAVNGIVFLI